MVVLRGIMRPTSWGKLWASLGNRAGGEQQGPGLCRMPGVVILGVSGRGYAGFWI